MPEFGDQRKVDLDSPWPGFLDLLDVNPRRALEELHVFTWKLCAARSPSILNALNASDRQDRIADLVLSCCADDFRRLRAYRNHGKPFAAWLSTVLVRQVLDWMRKRRPMVDIDENLADPADDPPREVSPKLLACLRLCMGRMSEKCRLYLACAADGMKPREIALLLRLPPGDNKKVSDDLRHCMRRMREHLISEGVTPEDLP